jgi:hypothetical protein
MPNQAASPLEGIEAIGAGADRVATDADPIQRYP